MKNRALQIAALIAAFVASQLLAVEGVLAHTGEDASGTHILVEFGLWALGVAAALAILVALFWLRARLRKGQEA